MYETLACTQSGRIISCSERWSSLFNLNFKLACIPDNRLKSSLGMVNFTDPPKRQAVTQLMCIFRNRESPEMGAEPWTCLVGEPVVMPWSVLLRSGGTCRSRSLIYCVVPRSVYSCSEEAHTCMHLLYHRYHPFDSFD